MMPPLVQVCNGLAQPVDESRLACANWTENNTVYLHCTHTACADWAWWDWPLTWFVL